MATYDHKHVLSDYATGKITAEMAVGHSLQHIEQLYVAQNEAKASRLDQQRQIDALAKHVHALQAAVDRLMAFVEKVRRKPKPPPAASQPKPDSP